jgi:uroporphyrinogen decarboxylase
MTRKTAISLKEPIMTNSDTLPILELKPDFRRLQAVLERKKPQRPVLFEFFMNDRLYQRLVPEIPLVTNETQRLQRILLAFYRTGYDYANILPPGFSFTEGIIDRPKESSVSQNAGSILHVRDDLSHFTWPDPDGVDLDLLRRLANSLQEGMKLIVYGPGGVLENATELVGYENLCIMIKEDPRLADQIFAQIGSRLERYYQLVAPLDFVGACISNDDWGFKTHTLFHPADMRRFVFPWHQRIAKAIHHGGKPAILHSCGSFEKVIDDVIEEMGYDGRHSYEDSIMPVEVAYDRYHTRIAILGGIDLDFVCRSTLDNIYQRASAMLARSAAGGGYALGTGNSVPEYVPDENFLALIRAAWDSW